jgi:hypothetical protein
MVILQVPCSTFTNFDHFAGVRKMTPWIVTRLLARGYGFLDRVLKALSILAVDTFMAWWEQWGRSRRDARSCRLSCKASGQREFATDW